MEVRQSSIARLKNDIWPSNWSWNLPELSEDAKEEAAHLIASRLKWLAETRNVHRPSTWRFVAKRRNLRVQEYADVLSEAGMYRPPTYWDSRGMVGINVALSVQTQLRAFVHELAHNELHIWVPPQLRGSADFYSYSGDVEEVRHAIARRVEELILG